MVDMEKCPFCKKEIDKTASKCPHCTQDLSFHRQPGCMFTVLGIAMVGTGIWFVWIPLIGFPMIGIGLLFVLIGIFSGVAQTVGFFQKKK